MFNLDIFSRIFGHKPKDIKSEEEPKQAEANELCLADAEAMIASSRQNILKELKESPDRSFTEISSYMSNLDATLNQLESENFEGEKIDARLLSILLDNKSNITNRIRKAMKQLQAKPDDNPEVIANYFDKSYTELAQTISDTNPNMQKISEYMDGKLSPIIRHMNSLVQSIAAQKTKISAEINKIKNLDDLAKKIDELKTILLKFEQIGLENKNMINNLEMLKNQKESLVTKLSELLQTEKYVELKEMESTKSTLSSDLKKVEGDFLIYISPLQRPLKKFLNAADKDHVKFKPKKSSEFPLSNLQLDSSTITTFREIMPHLKDAIEDGKVELKEDAKRKVMEKAGDIINSATLENFLQDKEKIEGYIQSIQAQINNFDETYKDSLEAEIVSIEYRLQSDSRKLSESEEILRKLSAKIVNINAEVGTGLESHFGKIIKISISPSKEI